VVEKQFNTTLPAGISVKAVVDTVDGRGLARPGA